MLLSRTISPSDTDPRISFCDRGCLGTSLRAVEALGSRTGGSAPQSPQRSRPRPSRAASQRPPGSAFPGRGRRGSIPAGGGRSAGRAGPGGAWPGGEARRGVPLEAARSPYGSSPAQEERRPCPARREDAENGGCRRRGAERRPRRGSGRVRGTGQARPGGSSRLGSAAPRPVAAAPEGAARGTREPRGAEPPALPSILCSAPRRPRLPRARGRAGAPPGPRGLGAAGPPLRPKMSGGARRRRRPPACAPGPGGGSGARLARVWWERVTAMAASCAP